MIRRPASSLIFLLLLFRAEAASGQQLKRFDAKSYPAGTFDVSLHDFPIGKFTVRVIQFKAVNHATSTNHPIVALGWK